jgi:hypothetical protein
MSLSVSSDYMLAENTPFLRDKELSEFLSEMGDYSFA